jgi:hypothetical protein
MQSIIYTYKNKVGGNSSEILKFIGNQPPCPICNDYGEYEDNGPKGCSLCNSRLIQFVNKSGNRVMADYGDTIVKYDDGTLDLIQGDDYEL